MQLACQKKEKEREREVEKREKVSILMRMKNVNEIFIHVGTEILSHSLKHYTK